MNKINRLLLGGFGILTLLVPGAFAKTTSHQVVQPLDHGPALAKPGYPYNTKTYDVEVWPQHFGSNTSHRYNIPEIDRYFDVSIDSGLIVNEKFCMPDNMKGITFEKAKRDNAGFDDIKYFIDTIDVVSDYSLSLKAYFSSGYYGQTKADITSKTLKLGYDWLDKYPGEAVFKGDICGPSTGKAENNIIEHFVLHFKEQGSMVHNVKSVYAVNEEINVDAYFFDIPKVNEPTYNTWCNVWQEKNTDATSDMVEKIKPFQYVSDDGAHAQLNQMTLKYLKPGIYQLNFQMMDPYNRVAGVKVKFRVVESNEISLVNWATKNMALDTYDPELHIGEMGPRNCGDYYLTAKAALTTLAQSEPETINVFNSTTNEYLVKARTRYLAWAAALGDTKPFEGTTIVAANTNVTGIGHDDVTIIVLSVAITAITLSGFVFFSRRKKYQNKTK